MTDTVETSMSESEIEELRRLQDYIFEIMLEVDRLCRQEGLTYYLGEGSLLGAARHGGFIPWDDDADLLMPREDYEKFLAIAPEKLREGYELDCIYTNPQHWSIPSMVQLTRSTEFEKDMYRGIALNCGPNLDIFPLDYVPAQESFEIRLRAKLINIFKRTLWIKTGIHTGAKYRTLKRRLMYYYPCRLVGMFTTVEGLHRRINRLLTKSGGSENGYLANFASLYRITRETFPKEWFAQPCELEFCGHGFCAPSQYEKVLEKLYGDYMTLPPVENRRSKHHFNNFNEE